MQRKIRIVRRFILASMLLIIAIILFLFIRSSRIGTPVQEISLARQNIAEAKRMNASKYSMDLYRKAVIYYDSAMKQWQVENEKLFFIRDYEPVRNFAIQANRFALQSIGHADKEITRTGQILKERINFLKKQTNLFSLRFGNFPLTKDERNSLTKSKLMLSEATLAFNNSNFQASEKNLDAAEPIIIDLNEKFEGILKDYFTNYPKWKKLVEESVKYSRNKGSYVIIIDKYNRDCMLYKSGIMQKRFDIELGRNWIGDKNCKGDNTTPEGTYKILSKKSGGETKFYKAMLLDYPNEEDRKRFDHNKRNGIIGMNAEIGGLIEIHGHGGKGEDWTNGCIALKDEDMDELYKMCGANTMVTIVGSITPLDKILSKKDE